MIKVLKPGFYTSVQDFGREGYQHFGVPYSGVMDRQSAAFANSLVGNLINDAVLELTMTGGVFLFKQETLIAICGANMSAKLNGIKVPLNKRLHIKPLDVLTFGKLINGFRCYIAVFGGFKTKTIMGSKSFYTGITPQSFLKKDDVLKIDTLKKIYHKNNTTIIPNFSFITNNLEVFKGPEYSSLSASQKTLLFNTPLTISNHSSRMGYQLKGFVSNHLPSIITSMVRPGTVQLTPSGMLIVLMRDCQTTGGYPRVLQLSTTAINILSQKYMGQEVYFMSLD